MRKRLIYLAVATTGISSIFTQLALIREFMNVFYGNELVIGIILANWLLLNGMGSYAGKWVGGMKRKEVLFAVMLFLVAVLPVAMLFFSRGIENLLVPGEVADVGKMFIYSFIILFPYCTVTGIFLVLASLIHGEGESGIGKVYLADGVGDVLGGAIFSFFLVYFLNSFEVIYIAMVANVFSALMVAKGMKRNYLFISLLLASIVSTSALLFVDLNDLTLRKMYRGQDILLERSTPYGHLVVTKTGEQVNFFENSIPFFSTNDPIKSEEAVHFALSQRKDTERVLLISAGFGAIDEAKKYASNVDYVEVDPAIIDTALNLGVVDASSANFFGRDGRLHVKNSHKRYDAIIISLSNPENAQVNRLYTVEFFREVKEALREGGVFELSLELGENYINREERMLTSIVYSTLKKAFKNVIILPASSTYFLASDGELDYNITGKMKERGIKARYVNENYMKGVLTEERLSYFSENIKDVGTLNEDFRPLAYYFAIVSWLRKFGISPENLLFFFLLLSFFLFFIFERRAENLCVLTTGFSSMATEVLLILAFESLYGYVYLAVGTILTFFMFGLVLGSVFANRNMERIKSKHFVMIEFFIFFLSFILPFLLLNAKDNNLSPLFFPVFLLSFATLSGMEFPSAARIGFERTEKTASTLYYSDLLGSFFGALLVSSFLIPLIGMINTCVVIAILNLLSFTFAFMKFRKM